MGILPQNLGELTRGTWQAGYMAGRQKPGHLSQGREGGCEPSAVASWHVPLAEVPFLGDTDASVLLPQPEGPMWMFSPLCFWGFLCKVSWRGVREQQHLCLAIQEKRSAEGGAAARGGGTG